MKINIAVISNIIFEPNFMASMNKYFPLSSINVDVYPIPYNEYTYQEYISQIMIADIIVIWLKFEQLFPDILNKIDLGIDREQQAVAEVIGLCERLYADVATRSSANILWFSFEDYNVLFPITTGHEYGALIDKINLELAEQLFDKAKLIDLKRLIAEIGIKNAYDLKGKYRWNSPYSKALVEAAVKEIHKQYQIEKGNTKKCLVLDCDNILWGGILSEDGIENIKLGGSGLGLAYQDFQRFILSLYHHGVILAVCSKNDLSDIIAIFRDHSEMVLKEENIACFQVNWENKPNNIKKISSILSIELDSIVFVDDSPIEIEAVKAMLPEVTAILYERDTAYEKFSCFNLKNNVSTANIEKRNETYHTNQSREALKSKYKNYADYIYALEIKIDIHEATLIECSRISELTQRTNKCTNGIRYTAVEIKERVFSENVTLYSLSVSDRFSDLGLVGALEVQGDSLTLFSLSCRALGREIENKMVEFILTKHKITSIRFKSTGKNADIKSFLLKAFPNATLTNCEYL